MPRKGGFKKNKKPVQEVRLNPLTAIAGGLVLVGKPFYFIFSRLIIAIVFILYTIGHGTSLLVNPIAKFFKKKPKIVKKTKKTKQLKVYVRLPKFTFPNYSSFFKLEWLRVLIFELRIWSRIKKLVKKAKFKPRFKTVFPILFILFLLSALYFSVLKGLPSPKELDSRKPEVSTKIYDRNGNILFKIYKNQNRTIAPPLPTLSLLIFSTSCLTTASAIS